MAKKRTIPQPIKPFVEAYLAVLQERKLPITAAYLFGSWAKGTQHKDSDIDVCVISPQLKGWTYKNRKLSKLPYDDLLSIEPHGFKPEDFNPAADPLAYEIVKYGIRVI